MGMSKVQALTGATGTAMERLEDQAKELGATTRFSATEAADAMSFLGMAGWETQEILSGMPGLLSLAAASAMDLGSAADVTSNIMSGFNIEASEAGRVADILAKASSSANTDVSQLGEALKYLAPIANTLGMSIEDATAAIMANSDAGIQGTLAGRTFATSLSRLAAPTSAMEKVMKKLNLSFFDSEGALKPLPDIIANMENGMEGMDEKTRAATLSTLFGAEAQKNWAVLLESGSDSLRDNSQALSDSEGAAKKMADIMDDNSKGAMREFRSALEGIGIAASKHMLPAVNDIIEKATELIRKFGELDDEQQKNIIKWGLIAAAVGPASLVLGGLITTLGGVLRAVSFISGAISGAGGLVSALGLLTNPIGLTIAGIAAVAGGIYLWNKHSNEAREVNLDVANSLIEQADALEQATIRYDELERSSKLTADEFGRLLDIQTDLERAQDPEKISKLKEEYESLTEKSGLSNDQIEEMIGLNNDIIEQSPMVNRSFTDRGNAVIESTDANYDYIQSLRDVAMEDLQIERLAALENEAKLRQENKELNVELAEVTATITKLLDDASLKESEINEKIEEGLAIKTELLEKGESIAEIEDEIAYWQAIQNGAALESLEGLREKRDSLIENITLNEQELDQLKEVDAAIAGIYLKSLGINELGKDGIKIADEKLQEMRKQRDNLIEQIKLEGDKGGVMQREVDNLNEQIGKHENILGQIEDETRLTSETLGVEKNRTAQQERMKKKLREIYGEAEGITKELGKDVTKNVNVTDNGTINKLNKRAGLTVSKTVLVSEYRTGGHQNYAVGTDHHPGGKFMAGEEGYELGRQGNNWEMLNYGMYDRPSGYKVYTHDETKSMLRALNNLPGYATGARPSGEAERIANQLQPTGTGGSTKITNHITVEGNLDSELYNQMMSQQQNDVDNELYVMGVKQR